MSVFDRYLEQAKDFARKLVRTETGTRRWATVTAIDPVRITYDGTTTQAIISPVVLGTPVTVGDRVRAHTINDKTYITRANPTDDEGTWATCTLAAGWATHLVPEVRNIAGLVVARGYIQRTTGTIGAGTTEAFTVPVGLRPDRVVRLPAVGSDGAAFAWRIEPTGEATVQSHSSMNGRSGWVSVDNLRWPAQGYW